METPANILTAQQISDSIARNLRHLIDSDGRTLDEIAKQAWPDRSVAARRRHLIRLKSPDSGSRLDLRPGDAAALSRVLGVRWTELYSCREREA